MGALVSGWVDAGGCMGGWRGGGGVRPGREGGWGWVGGGRMVCSNETTMLLMKAYQRKDCCRAELSRT